MENGKKKEKMSAPDSWRVKKGSKEGRKKGRNEQTGLPFLSVDLDVV